MKSVCRYLVGPETSDFNRLPFGTINKFSFVTSDLDENYTVIIGGLYWVKKIFKIFSSS